uniref:Related to VMA21-ATPase assembly integral membrane protein n=1 Tax=Melanopsichium pennsylvanicum 4 TaxID=1398559 RepID=A0A077R8D1_9BASI|nr:related to VMA21-ATPase assembly integral membrane protein [Melanopsichium pennsylvanicum 4]
MSSLDVTPSRVAPRGRDPATGVYYKLAFFSVALFAAPLSAYFFAKDRYFDGKQLSLRLLSLLTDPEIHADDTQICTGNATYAGGLAALVVNLVLAAYVVAAFLEDDSDIVSPTKRNEQQEKEGKKEK